MFCSSCGNFNSDEANFCTSCGQQLSKLSGHRLSKPKGCHISITRIYVLSILSFGLYLAYWLYKTWEQYRDHTSTAAYPIWHGLTIFVPVYQFFRLHAHIRVFKDLMDARKLPNALEPVIVVAVVAIAGYGNTFLRIALPGSVEDILLGRALLEVSYLIATIALTWIVASVQRDINSYWCTVDANLAQRAGIGKGEVIVAIIGLICWAGTIQGLIDAL